MEYKQQALLLTFIRVFNQYYYVIMVCETKYSGTKVQYYNSKLYGTPVLAKRLTSVAKQHSATI